MSWKPNSLIVYRKPYIEGDFHGTHILVRNAVPAWHKIAVRTIPKGEEVITFGKRIGKVTLDIDPGEHVRFHNLTTCQATEQWGQG
jgi:hypothetical protein